MVTRTATGILQSYGRKAGRKRNILLTIFICLSCLLSQAQPDDADIWETESETEVPDVQAQIKEIQTELPEIQIQAWKSKPTITIPDISAFEKVVFKDSLSELEIYKRVGDNREISEVPDIKYVGKSDLQLMIYGATDSSQLLLCLQFDTDPMYNAKISKSLIIYIEGSKYYIGTNAATKIIDEYRKDISIRCIGLYDVTEQLSARHIKKELGIIFRLAISL